MDFITTSRGSKIGFEVQSDGVYLTYKKEKGLMPSLDEIVNIITSRGIQDHDFKALNRIIQSRDDQITVLISTNSKLKAIDEYAKVEIAENKMSASIYFYEALNGGKTMSESDIYTAIAKAGVTYGILKEEISKLSQKRNYRSSTVIAKGLDNVNGADGFLTYNFNVNKKSHKPKLNEDGTVDYKNLDLIEIAKNGQLLVTMTLPTDGKPGKNVLGREISFTRGKPAKLPAGKNVRVSEDELSLYATTDGQIQFTDSKVSVLPVYEVAGNVDSNTGNIQFLGTVIIKGNVLSGFSIVSTGPIQIFGVVEGASLHSEADIAINGGVQGMGKAKLIAGGNITAKFLENCTVRSNKDITADAIMHTNVWCGGSLTLRGKRALLVGGNVKVAHEMIASTIGSTMATRTEIEVGMSLELYAKYTELKGELSALRLEIENYDKVIDLLMKAKNSGVLSDDKKIVLIKTIRTKSLALEKVENLKHEIEEILPSLETSNGKIKVQKTIHPGVRIMIGNAVMYIREELKFCTLYNSEGEIKRISFA